MEVGGHFSSYSIWRTRSGAPGRKIYLILGPANTLVMRLHIPYIEHATVRYQNAEQGALRIYNNPETTVRTWWETTFHHEKVNDPATFIPNVYDITESMIDYPLNVVEMIQGPEELADISSIFIPFQRADPGGSAMSEEGSAQARLQEYQIRMRRLQAALVESEGTITRLTRFMKLPSTDSGDIEALRQTIETENEKMERLREDFLEQEKNVIRYAMRLEELQDDESSEVKRLNHPENEGITRFSNDGKGTYACRIHRDTHLVDVRRSVEQMAIRMDLANFMIDNSVTMQLINSILPPYDLTADRFYISNDTLKLRNTKTDEEFVKFLTDTLNEQELLNWAFHGYREIQLSDQSDHSLRGASLEVFRHNFNRIVHNLRGEELKAFLNKYYLAGGCPVSNGTWWYRSERVGLIIFQLLTACGKLVENIENGTQLHENVFEGSRSDNIVQILADEGGDEGMHSAVLEEKASSALNCFRFILNNPRFSPSYQQVEVIGKMQHSAFIPERPFTWLDHMIRNGFKTNFVHFNIVISSVQCRGKAVIDGGSSPVHSASIDGGSSPVRSASSIEEENKALGTVDPTVLSTLARTNHIFLVRLHGCRYSGYTASAIIDEHRRADNVRNPNYHGFENLPGVSMHTDYDGRIPIGYMTRFESISSSGETSNESSSGRGRDGFKSGGISKQSRGRGRDKGRGYKGSDSRGGRGRGPGRLSPRRKSVRKSRRKSARKSRRKSVKKSRRKSARKSRRKSARKSRRK